MATQRKPMLIALATVTAVLVAAFAWIELRPTTVTAAGGFETFDAVYVAEGPDAAVDALADVAGPELRAMTPDGVEAFLSYVREDLVTTRNVPPSVAIQWMDEVYAEAVD